MPETPTGAAHPEKEEHAMARSKFQQHIEDYRAAVHRQDREYRQETEDADFVENFDRHARETHGRGTDGYPVDYDGPRTSSAVARGNGEVVMAW